MRLRKVLAALLSLVLCLSMCTACAEVGSIAPQAALEEKAEMVNTVPEAGEKIAGFTVNRIREYDPLDAQIVYLTHDKTGAPVMWIANDDTERSFEIGFRTHYDTDTGVPHIFEHAALSGSEKYPDAGLVFNMISNTCQTYLNASTYTQMTSYDCASISDKQLLKFADVDLAGVFKPLVLSDPHAMQREAYRYELEDADADLTLTGTVYSEMQGSYYAYQKYFEEYRALYPGSWYSTCTGGVPGLIETMTQQDLIDFHSTYYQPSNAMLVLYGDLNLEDFLTLIAEYYDEYDMASVSADDPGYTPITGTAVKTIEIPVSSDAAAESTLYYAMPVKGLPDVDLILFSDFIETAIYNPASALYNLMMEHYPESNLRIEVVLDGPDPMMTFELSQAPDEDAAAFAALIEKGLSDVLTEGIQYDLLSAKAKEIAITNSRIRENNGIGIDFSTMILFFYTLGGSMDLYCDYVEALLGDMQFWFDTGIFEKTISEQFIAPEDSLQLVMRSVPGQMEEIQAEAAQRLIDKKAAMTEDEIAKTVADTADFAAWTEEVSKVSMIDQVKAVTVEDLPEDVKSATASVTTENGVRYITSEIENSPTTTVSLYLKADMIPTDKLQAFSFAVNMLGTNSTGKHSYDELETLMTEYGLSFDVTTIKNGETDFFKPAVKVTIDCLNEDFDNALTLADEILTDSTFADYDILSYMSSMTAASAKIEIPQSEPHYLAYAIGSATVSDISLYQYNVESLPLYQYMEGVAAMDDETIAAEAEEWKSLLGTVVNRDGLSCGIISSADGIRHAEEGLQDMTASWPLSFRESVDYGKTLEKLPKRIAVLIPGSAAYNLKIGTNNSLDYSYKPEMSIMNKLVYDQLLIPIMRYTNGVYSPMSDIGEEDSYILAYRDPSMTKTYEEVIPALGGQVADMELTDEQLSGLVVSTYTGYAMPKGPRTQARIAISDVLCNTDTPAKTLRTMEAFKTITPESLKACSWVYDALSEKGSVVSVLPEGMYKENPEYFDSVITWLID